MKLSTLLVASFFVFSSAFAGTEIGNGGDAVVCRDASGNISRVTMLDHYEAIKKFRLKPFLGPANLSPMDKAKLAISRIPNADGERKKRLLGWLQTFQAESNPMDNIQLEDVPDSMHTIIENGCEVKQIVVQREPRFREEARYEISNDLFKRLDADNVAVMLLHEILYREALSEGAENSIGTRYLTAKIISETAPQIELKNYLEILTAAEFSRPCEKIEFKFQVSGYQNNFPNPRDFELHSVCFVPGTVKKQGDFFTGLLSDEQNVVYSSYRGLGMLNLIKGEFKDVATFDKEGFLVKGRVSGNQMLVTSFVDHSMPPYRHSEFADNTLVEIKGRVAVKASR